MTQRPLKPCNAWGCAELVTAGQQYCEKHRKQKDREYERKRRSSVERGYDKAWQKARAMKASQDPLCERCLKRGIVKPMNEVHHIIPIDVRPDLRLAMSNLESICLDCHHEEHKEDRWQKRQ